MVSLAAALSTTSCTDADQTEYPIYQVMVNEELGCVELVHADIVFRPFGVLGSRTLRGKRIGVREDVPDAKIYEIKGYDSGEWIVEYLEVIMGGNMVFKATGVREVPAELEQFREYDW